MYSQNGRLREDDKNIIKHIMLSSVGLGVEMPEHYI